MLQISMSYQIQVGMCQLAEQTFQFWEYLPVMAYLGRLNHKVQAVDSDDDTRAPANFQGTFSESD